MGVSKRQVTTTLLDTAEGAPSSCFVLICLCCYNLGRLAHETVAHAFRETPESPPGVRYHCKTCDAFLYNPVQP